MSCTDKSVYIKVSVGDFGEIIRQVISPLFDLDSDPDNDRYVKISMSADGISFTDPDGEDMPEDRVFPLLAEYFGVARISGISLECIENNLPDIRITAIDS